MNHLYNNHDDKIRSKLTEHEFEFDPSAWDNMANQLDQHDFAPEAVVWWKSLPVLGVSLLVGSIAIGSYLWSSKTMDSTTVDPFLAPRVIQQEAPAASQPRTPITKPAEQETTAPLAEVVNKPKKVSKAKEQKVTKSETVKKQLSKKATDTKEAKIAVLDAEPKTNEVKLDEETTTPVSKKIKTIVRRQYSTTPLKKKGKEVMEVRTKKTPVVNNFGIGIDAPK